MRADEGILYTIDNNETGRQFFKKCLGLSPFGRQEIVHCLKETEFFYAKNPSFSDLSTNNFNFYPKKLLMEKKF